MYGRQHAAGFLAFTSAAFFALVVSAAENDWPNSASWPAWADVSDGESQVEPVDDREARRWERWLVPLPKRTRWAGKVVLPASAVAVRLRAAATGVEQTARDELVALIGEKAGGQQPSDPFTILIGVFDAQGTIDGVAMPGAESLRGLKNDDQAYLITPLGTRGLAVAGLTERGVYYGVKTLQQLIEPGVVHGNVTLPVVAVLDWPDLAERGFWEFQDLEAPATIQYMADRKLNLIEVRTVREFDEAGKATLAVDVKNLQEARLRAVNWIPFISHLNNLGDRTDIYKHYPHLEGQGSRARNPRHPHLVVPCASHPQFAHVLAEMLMSADAQGAADVNIFLSELEGQQCECDKCKGTSQFVWEAKASVRAWQIARKTCPQLRLRILLSQGSYDVNDQVLAAVPEPEIGITYYSGSTTYTAAREPMIYPLMEAFLKQGRWLGVYPTLTASYRLACPWSGPQFMKYRMTEYVDKGLACMCGFAPPDYRFCDFNLTAAAEWSWNSHGRSEHEFAAAWATRRGLTDPEKAADWAVMLGPVGWDVYGSGVPHPYFFSRAAAIVKGRHTPVLGESMFRYFPTIEHMDDNLAVCAKALKLAEQLNDPTLIAETRVIEGYVRMIKSIYLIANTVAGKKELDNAETASVQATFDELCSAMQQTTEAIDAWNGVVAANCDIEKANKAKIGPVAVTRQTVADIAEALAPFGIEATQGGRAASQM